MRFLFAGLSAVVLAVSAPAREFTVVAYNVENLFDADGAAVYDDYQPAAYTHAHLLTKVRNIAEIVSRFDGGRGPDIILFNEIELDQTPDSRVDDYPAFLREHADATLEQMLAAPLAPALAGLPAEAWLIKALHDRGLTGYTVVAGSDAPSKHEDGHPRSIKNVIFTRFPVKAARNHPILNARNIVEALLDADGHPLYVFANHWKAGAGDRELEQMRVENARVLRARLDEILAADPQADIIVGGDFNSQHNQKLRHRAMKMTGINDALGSQGNELAIRGRDRDLYNLWYELPEEERGSDVYRGEWNTLMQIIISRGLYDRRGVQYIDNSFAVARFPGLNADAIGQPVRWSFSGPAGAGFSDHFPLSARFRTVKDNRPDRWLALQRPSNRHETEARVNKIDYVAAAEKVALTAATLPAGADLRDGGYTGKIFLVEGVVTAGWPFIVEFRGQTYEIYSPLRSLRDEMPRRFKPGDRIRFYGELGLYRGRWQFVIATAAWVM